MVSGKAHVKKCLILSGTKHQDPNSVKISGADKKGPDPTGSESPTLQKTIKVPQSETTKVFLMSRHFQKDRKLFTLFEKI
jgi:hypothetical protein